ncbi:Hypothetical protein SCF082_LOCUS4735 [Durusdinium trenchii]|uniref:Tetratricopeptide repeat-containing protein n=1 Tax=Durusdinium trenchii TaxID=1381693 RepID=A0ABP0I165_9DINO
MAFDSIEEIPSYDLLEDADALDWLWLHSKPWKIFSFSPVQAERRHSFSVFENLAAKRECHEALFGQGRLLLLDGKSEEALALLEEANKSSCDAGYLSWFAWALLLVSKDQSFYRRFSTQQRSNSCCKDALVLHPGFSLALRCLAHLEPESIPNSVGLDPVAHLVACGRQALDASTAQQRRQGASALRSFLAEVQSPEDLPNVCLLLGTLGATASSSGCPAATSSGWVSAKLMALDSLWRYWTKSKRPNRAAEAALVAVGALRSERQAWQRAVVLALKALALDGQWDECWRLASAELSFHTSREILYQCGRLAHYDGRQEARQAYLPHLRGMWPLVPHQVQPYVGFWLALLEFKEGIPLVAARKLQDLWPRLQEGSFQSLQKQRLAKESLDLAEQLKADVERIYELSNALWLSASGKDDPATVANVGAQAGNGYSPASTGGQNDSTARRSENGHVHRRPPGWEERSRRSHGSTPEEAALPHLSPTISPWRRLPDGPKKPKRELRWLASGLGSAWKVFEAWRAQQALKSVEANDAFLGSLCKGRLHFMLGELDEAQRIWSDMCSEEPGRVEGLLELWRLHDAQEAHKKAVLCARKALELTTSELQVSVEAEMIFHHKAWGGAAGEALTPRHWVRPSFGAKDVENEVENA